MENKYPLLIEDEQHISIPMLCDSGVIARPSAQVLSVDVQNDAPCLWCMVDDDREARDVCVVLCGTGQNADKTKGMTHVGSFMLLHGTFVGHVFMW